MTALRRGLQSSFTPNATPWICCAGRRQDSGPLGARPHRGLLQPELVLKDNDIFVLLNTVSFVNCGCLFLHPPQKWQTLLHSRADAFLSVPVHAVRSGKW